MLAQPLRVVSTPALGAWTHKLVSDDPVGRLVGFRTKHAKQGGQPKTIFESQLCGGDVVERWFFARAELLKRIDSLLLCVVVSQFLADLCRPYVSPISPSHHHTKGSYFVIKCDPICAKTDQT